MMQIREFQNFIVLDENLNNSFIAGNKIRKLQGIIENEEKLEGILSFGSPYSSHLLACAYYAKKLNIPFVGIVLSNKDIEVANFPHLIMAKKFGANLKFSKTSDATENIGYYKNQLNNYYWIPGGAHTLEAANAYEKLFNELFMNNRISGKIKHLIIPYGTGTTAYGIWKSVRRNNPLMTVHGVSVSRLKEKCLRAISELKEFDNFPGLQIDDQFAGKYGYLNKETEKYRWRFFEETGILPDPVYNAKSIHYYYQYQFENVLIVNTGGMLNNLL